MSTSPSNRNHETEKRLSGEPLPNNDVSARIDANDQQRNQKRNAATKQLRHATIKSGKPMPNQHQTYFNKTKSKAEHNYCVERYNIVRFRASRPNMLHPMRHVRNVPMPNEISHDTAFCNASLKNHTKVQMMEYQSLPSPEVLLRALHLILRLLLLSPASLL